MKVAKESLTFSQTNTQSSSSSKPPSSNRSTTPYRGRGGRGGRGGYRGRGRLSYPSPSNQNQ